MGIDVYTEVLLKGEYVSVKDLPIDWNDVLGDLAGEWVSPGYIRESYHGCIYPTRHFIPESFDHSADDGYVHIPLSVLKERLPETIEMSRRRNVETYGCEPDAEDGYGPKQYAAFVKVHEYLARGDMPAYILNYY